jgi:uncharacterized membrane protein
MDADENTKMVFQETRTRSLVKATIYRILSIAGTSILSWLITRDIGEALIITVVVQIYLMVLYYSSERTWDRISWGRRVKIN